jgi:hypothetical protein
MGEDSLDVSAHEIRARELNPFLADLLPKQQQGLTRGICGKLLELRRGKGEGADIIDGEMELGVLGEVAMDRHGESRAS